MKAIAILSLFSAVVLGSFSFAQAQSFEVQKSSPETSYCGGGGGGHYGGGNGGGHYGGGGHRGGHY